jgi:hypothetical protein
MNEMKTCYRLACRGIRAGMFCCVDKTAGKRTGLQATICRRRRLGGLLNFIIERYQVKEFEFSGSTGSRITPPKWIGCPSASWPGNCFQKLNIRRRGELGFLKQMGQSSK